MLAAYSNNFQSPIRPEPYKAPVLLFVLGIHIVIAFALWHKISRVELPTQATIDLPLVWIDAQPESQPAPTPKPQVKPEPKIQPKPQPTPKPIPKLETLLPTPTPMPVEMSAPVQPKSTPSAVAETAPTQVENTTAAPRKAEPPPIVEARFDAAYLNNPKPHYPVLSKRMGETGKVLLRVKVSEAGLPLSVDINTSSGFSRLDNAALEAVKQWRFIPAHQGEQKIAASVLVPIEFKIDN